MDLDNILRKILISGGYIFIAIGILSLISKFLIKFY